jgi:ankyrin repeat protein
MRLLLDRGADVDAEDNNHSTPLHLASSQWDVEAATLLVERGANVQVQNNNGQTPLHLASEHGVHDTMRLLLDGGADMDAEDNNHSTPLHLASQWNVEAAKLFIERGANVHVRNKGQTSLHLASERRYHNFMRLLLDRGADMDAQDNNLSTPWRLARIYGANVEGPDKKGNALFQAALARLARVPWVFMPTLSEYVENEDEM